jgi:two-component system invasion response regulator UvrY
VDNETVKIARVLIVEDDVFTRTTLTSALTSHGVEVVLATDNAKSALDLVTNKQIDLALLDLDLGTGPTGLDIATALRRKDNNIGIIFITSYSDPRLIGSNNPELPVGSRYLTKSSVSNINILINLIIQTKQNPLQKSNTFVAKKVDLTKQQIEIMRLIAAGYSSSKIAQELEVSEKTVESIISKINKSLGITRLDQKNLRVQMVKAYYALTGKQVTRD